MSKPRVTVVATPVVWVSVSGAPHRDPFRVRDDGGLVGRLVKWMGAEGIYTAWGTPGSSGAGRFNHAFAPDDADRVLAWLAEQGDERVEEHPRAK